MWVVSGVALFLGDRAVGKSSVSIRRRRLLDRRFTDDGAI
jgi:hypothetical protein